MMETETKGPDSGTRLVAPGAGAGVQLYDYGFRWYHASLGRWTARDPIGNLTGSYLYTYLSNDPYDMVEVLGLYGKKVHSDLTMDWAIEVRITFKYALLIGKENNNTDSVEGPFPLIGIQGRHFNMSRTGRQDSRLKYADEEFELAKKECGVRLTRCVPKNAALHLGRGLHSLQDWVAHGDLGSGNKIYGFILSIHNNYSPQRNFGSDPSKYPDDETLDADGPDGRATYNVLFYTEFDWDYALFHKGPLRLAKARELTKNYIIKYQDYINSTEVCCECKNAFDYKNSWLEDDDPCKNCW